jgi:hypothetical protein
LINKDSRFPSYISHHILLSSGLSLNWGRPI